ncbi:hypothetical protein PBV87_09085 [Niameybacter massiliensis]|uniref:Uncharacterized protein n=1 Tax=Holtiella tumoricola TaxID=3018743 RepID=A0AA42J0W5_9FIRM|nr:hypothetical protein [Holtiella tumoricola]MDA3731628.1 hypothetical protein [Holtiella tumoricola]
MTVREKRALKRNLSRWFDQAMKWVLEVSVIIVMGTSFMLGLWCCI